MKTLTTLTAIAALVAGISIASAQNQGGQKGSDASPSNINKGADTNGAAKSGSTAMQPGGSKSRVATGTGKFCVQISKSSGSLNCKFASMDACEKEAQAQGLQCQPNPNSGTTGAK
jgi:hypothetical protein